MLAINYNPQGNMIVTGSFDETVRLWDVRNGCLIRCLFAHSETVTSIDFNWDGSILLSSGCDGLIRGWDMSCMKCIKTMGNNNNDPTPITFTKWCPNSMYLLQASIDQTLKIWNFQTQTYTLILILFLYFTYYIL